CPPPSSRLTFGPASNPARPRSIPGPLRGRAAIVLLPIL
ncbi:MAG: hypothetical protein, partial [Olavius algarvensis Gamma 1 endosymbiont]